MGRHQVIPVPFNQPGIARPPTRPCAGSPYQQNYTYGYTVRRDVNLPDGTCYQADYEGGNVDLAFPTSVTRPSRSTTRPPASTPTTRFRRMSKSA